MISSYVGDSATIRPVSRRHTPVVIGALIAAVATILLSVLALVPSASANMFDDWFCGKDLGGWTSYQGSDDQLGADDIMANGGKYSVMDLYGSVIRWTTYNGNTGGGDDIKNFDTGKLVKGVDTGGKSKTNVTSAAKDSRHLQHCLSNVVGTMFANLILRVSGIVVKFLSIFVTIALNPHIICENPSNPGGGCVNLIGLIGGTGSGNGGIINTLYQGLYLSLAMVVLTVTAVWSLLKAAKGQLRNAGFGLIWAFVSFLLGVIVLSNPMLLAQAPMKASTLLGSCVTEALNGRSCLSNQSVGGSTASPDSMCLIDPNANIASDEHLALDARMATCKMWKAFVLEPWSEGQFGMSYESLETSSSDLIAKSPSAKSLAYWKNLKTSMTGSSLNSICSTTTGTYSNIALYQLDLMSSIHDCGGTGGGAGHSSAKTADDGGVYNDWYYLVDIMSQAKADTGTGADNVSNSWNLWAGNTTSTRFNLALVAVFAALASATIIIPSAVKAIGYMFIGTILTVFAPLFMLAGIHPGTGRKIFLGWLELEIGAVLKYLFTVLWLSVIVEVYGAILGSSTSAATTLAFVIAMTATLKAYGSELTELFGKVDLGGRKLSNAMGRKFDKSMNKVRGLKNAAFGGAMAGMVNGEGGLGSRLRSAKDMAGYQVMQQGKYMGGFAGNAMMSADKILDGRRREMVHEAERQNKVADDMVTQAHADTSAAQGKAAIEAKDGFEGFDLEDDDAKNKAKSYYRSEQVNIRSEKKYAGIGDIDGARSQAIKSWDAKVNTAVKDGTAAKGKDGIYRSIDGSKESTEAAYRRNEAEQAALIAQAKKVKDNNGVYHYQFDKNDDEKRFHQLDHVLNDDKAIAAHQQWKSDSEQYGELAAQEKFGQLKSQGKLDSSISDINDAYAARDERNGRLEKLDHAYDHTVAAIDATQQAKTLESKENEIRSGADHLHKVNEDITSRTQGAMYTGGASRRLRAQGAELDDAVNSGGTGVPEMQNADYAQVKSRVLHHAGATAASVGHTVVQSKPVQRVAHSAPVEGARTVAHTVRHPLSTMSGTINRTAKFVSGPSAPTPTRNPHYNEGGQYTGPKNSKF